VPIKDEISGDAPHLPGMKAPKSCHESSDCPPDFPGCSKSGEAAGDNGEDNGDKKDEEGGSKPSGSYRKVWIGVAGALDFQSIAAGNDLCRLDTHTALPANSANIYCVNQDGSDFPFYPRTDPRASGQNNELVQGSAGTSAGGFKRGDARLMLSFDYALTANLLVGARIGVTLFKYPGQAAYADGNAWGVGNGRLYLDVRGTWVFGENALAKTFAPMVFAGVGAASFDTRTDSGVVLQSAATGQVQSGDVQLWQMNGPFFAMVGGGVRITVAEVFATSIALRVNGSFGPNGFIPTLGPELGLAYGF
jgi:hypothetical protein